MRLGRARRAEPSNVAAVANLLYWLLQVVAPRIGDDTLKAWSTRWVWLEAAALSVAALLLRLPQLVTLLVSFWALHQALRIVAEICRAHSLYLNIPRRLRPGVWRYLVLLLSEVTPSAIGNYLFVGLAQALLFACYLPINLLPDWWIRLPFAAAVPAFHIATDISLFDVLRDPLRGLYPGPPTTLSGKGDQWRDLAWRLQAIRHDKARDPLESLQSLITSLADKKADLTPAERVYLADAMTSVGSERYAAMMGAAAGEATSARDESRVMGGLTPLWLRMASLERLVASAGEQANETEKSAIESLKDCLLGLRRGFEASVSLHLDRLAAMLLSRPAGAYSAVEVELVHACVPAAAREGLLSKISSDLLRLSSARTSTGTEVDYYALIAFVLPRISAEQQQALLDGPLSAAMAGEDVAETAIVIDHLAHIVAASDDSALAGFFAAALRRLPAQQLLAGIEARIESLPREAPVRAECSVQRSDYTRMEPNPEYSSELEGEWGHMAPPAEIQVVDEEAYSAAVSSEVDARDAQYEQALGEWHRRSEGLNGARKALSELIAGRSPLPTPD